MTSTDERELVLGNVYGLRAWDWSRKRGLVSPMYPIQDWKDGENIAKCVHRDSDVSSTLARLNPWASSMSALTRAITAAVIRMKMYDGLSEEEARKAVLGVSHFDNCSCGFYAAHTKNRALALGSVIGVIKCGGRVNSGPLGHRAEKATPVALTVVRKPNKKTFRSIRELKAQTKGRKLFDTFWLVYWIVFTGVYALMGTSHASTPVGKVLMATLFAGAWLGWFCVLESGYTGRLFSVIGHRLKCRGIKKKYPSVQIYDNVDTMINAYPLGLSEKDEQ